MWRHGSGKSASDNSQGKRNIQDNKGKRPRRWTRLCRYSSGRYPRAA
nr:MAG TPA: hypothetical protein [Caudoviricetes sp.]